MSYFLESEWYKLYKDQFGNMKIKTTNTHASDPAIPFLEIFLTVSPMR